MENTAKQTGNKIYFFAIVFDLIVQVAFSFVLTGFALSVGTTNPTELKNYSTLNLLAMIAIQAAFFAVFATITKKSGAKPEIFLKKPDFKQILFGVVCAIICLTCFSWLGEWVIILLDAVNFPLTMLEINGATDVILAIIATVLCAPIAEELVFRSALLTDLAKTKKTAVAVVLSGLAFALMHMNVQQTVYQFFLGCTCAYAAIKTGNVLIPMLIHAINNLGAIAISLLKIPIFTPPEGQISTLMLNPALSAIITAALAVAGCLAIYFLGKKMFKTAPDFSAQPPQPPQNRTLFIGAMAICSAMWAIGLVSAFIPV